MKRQVQSLWYLGALVLFLSVAISLNAQQAPQTQQPEPQTQQPAAQPPAPQAVPDRLPDQSGQATPDSKAQSSQTGGVQSFTGNIMKSGNKYMFQDAASGDTYDIDHQDEVKKYEGKRVTVHGTLDGKMIHINP